MTTDTLEKSLMNDEPRPAAAADESARQASPMYPPGIHGLLRGAVSTLAPVVITGERGTRKRALLRMIHRGGPGPGSPLFFVRAEQFPGDLAELLRRGGDGLEGTLVLLGIEHLSAPMQEVIHEYLDTGRLTVMGVSQPAALRIAALSEKRLASLLALPELDRSLLHRLCIVPLDLPPLRERQAEILRIAAFFIDRFCTRYRMTPKEFSPEAQRSLLEYQWPENLDELEGVVGRSLAASEGREIMTRDLSFLPGAANPAAGSVPEAPRIDLGTPLRAGNAADDAGQSMALRLAHEIKNPLVSIQTYANLLEEKFGDNEFRGEFYQVMKRDVAKIDQVVEELLAASREGVVEGDPGERPAKRLGVDINALVEGALLASLVDLSHRRIAVFRDLDKEIPPVSLNENPLNTALTAIVALVSGNTKTGGDLYLRTARAAFQGRDNGDVHFVQVAMEGTPFQADMEQLRQEVACTETALASMGAHMELKESVDGRLSAVVTLPLAPAEAGREEK